MNLLLTHTHTHKKNDAISTQVGNFYLYIKKKPERYNDDDRNVLSNESYYFFLFWNKKRPKM